MRRISAWALILAIALPSGQLVSAGPPAASPPAASESAGDPLTHEQVSYRRHVLPILKRHCWGCHADRDPQGGLSMETPADIVRGGNSGSAWEAGQPDNSLLIRLVSGSQEPVMPKGKPRLSPKKIAVLSEWIRAGAPDDSPRNVQGSALAIPVVIPDAYRRAPAVTSLAFSPDGQYLAAACQSEVVILGLAGDSPPRRLTTECELVTCVEYSPDGSAILAAGGSPSQFGELRLFDAASGALRSARRMGHDTLLRGAFSPDGGTIAMGGTDGAIWVVSTSDASEPKRFELHSDWVSDVAFSPDGSLLISGGRDKAVKVSTAETGKLVRSIGSSAELISAVAAAPNLAIAAGRDALPTSFDLAIALADAQFNGPIGNDTKPVDNAPQYTRRLETQPGEVLDCALDAARTTLALCGNFDEVRVYRLADLARLETIALVPSPVYAVALSSDGTRLAAGGLSGEISLYELPGGALLKRLVPVPIAAPLP